MNVFIILVEGMDTWTEEQLEDVVSKKHGDSNKKLPPTSIVRTYFVITHSKQNRDRTVAVLYFFYRSASIS